VKETWKDDTRRTWGRTRSDVVGVQHVWSVPYTSADRPIENTTAPGNDARLAVLAQVAGGLGVSPNQVVLAWLDGRRDCFQIGGCVSTPEKNSWMSDSPRHGAPRR